MRTLFVSLALGLCASPTMAQDLDIRVTPLKVAMETPSVMPCDTPALTPIVGTQTAQTLANNVVQIMCLAAKSDGDVSLAEAKKIIRAHKSQDLVTTQVALSSGAEVETDIETLSQIAIEVAVREAVHLIVSDTKISPEEQIFVGELTKSVNLAPERVLEILGLVD